MSIDEMGCGLISTNKCGRVIKAEAANGETSIRCAQNCHKHCQRYTVCSRKQYHSYGQYKMNSSYFKYQAANNYFNDSARI